MGGVAVPLENAVIFGQYGLRKVDYLGTLNGRYKAPVTCHLYEVRVGQPLYVDQRDLGTLLSLRGGAGEELFRLRES